MNWFMNEIAKPTYIFLNFYMIVIYMYLHGQPVNNFRPHLNVAPVFARLNRYLLLCLGSRQARALTDHRTPKIHLDLVPKIAV